MSNVAVQVVFEENLHLLETLLAWLQHLGRDPTSPTSLGMDPTSPIVLPNTESTSYFNVITEYNYTYFNVITTKQFPKKR